MVRAFAHGAAGPLGYFSFQPVLRDRSNKSRSMCYPLWHGADKRVAHVAAAGLLSRYLNGPLPYVRRHITVNKNVLTASLNKTFPSFQMY